MALYDLAKTMGEMKGGLMKLGQMLSISEDLFLPPEVSALFKSLQKDAPPMASEDFDEMIRRNYPQGLDAHFQSFEKGPFAQASIGQVHRARLKSGERVVVKVQYPRIEEAIKGDLKSLDLLEDLLNKVIKSKPDLRTTLEEIRESLILECDYLAEAQNIDYARKHICQEFPQLRIPRVYSDLSTAQVIVLEEMQGESFKWTLTATQKQKDQWGQLLYDLHQYCFSKLNFLHTDPQAGNYLFNDNEVIILDFGSCRRFSPSFVQSYTLLLQALEDQCFDNYNKMAREFGFFTPDDPDELIYKHYQLISKLYTPYAREGSFPLESINPFDLMRPFLKEISLDGRSGPVKEFLLLDRSHFGLYTKLRQWGSSINWVASRTKYRRHILSASHSLKS